MTFGPFPPHFIEILKTKLDAMNAGYKILSDDEALGQLKEKNLNRLHTTHPTYDGAIDLLHIEIDPSHLLIIKQDLENMGVLINPKDFDPEFDREEYLCPRCDFVSDRQGLCPKHRIPLVDFSTYAAAKKESSDRQSKKWLRGIVLVVAILVGSIYFELWRWLR